MFSELELVRIITDLVPNWGYNLNEPSSINIKIGQCSYRIETCPGPTSYLKRWSTDIQPCLDKILNSPSSGSKFFDNRVVEEALVIEWLKVKGYNADWLELFDYNRLLESRTYENDSVGFTFILDSEETGQMSLVDITNQKLLDVLAETNYTFFVVDRDWNYLDYNYINWGYISQPLRYTLSPGFIYPYKCALTMEQCAITRTKRGDLIIYDSHGLLAAYRKGSWKIYEIASLKNSLVKMIGSKTYYWLGANLLDILFDLSYRRHGALIIIDIYDSYKSFINNIDSCLSSNGQSFQTKISNRLNDICLNAREENKISKPILLELASIDGALVINRRGQIIAFGAMIKSHEKATTELGARSSAALSAYYFGALAFKVSSDGEIVAFINDGSGRWENGIYVPSESPKKVVFF